MFGKRKVAALVAEFLGAGILTLLILSVQRSTIGVPFFVAAAGGLTVAMLTFALASTSGGYFNPALTLGMWVARRVSTLTAILYIAVQLLGGWAAYGVYTYFVNNSLQKVGGHFSWHIFTAEAVGTGIFVFGWAAARARRIVNNGAAAFAGLSYMVGIVAASSAAIGLLNPAVALGVRAWVWGTYVAGPVAGAIVGGLLYELLFVESQELAEAAVTRPNVSLTEINEVVVEPAPIESAASRRGRSTTAKAKAPSAAVQAAASSGKTRAVKRAAKGSRGTGSRRTSNRKRS